MTDTNDEQRDDGGPAFPMIISGKSGVHIQQGMRLRDYFAGQALAGLVANTETPIDMQDHGPTDYAEASYDYADAMLAARQR